MTQSHEIRNATTEEAQYIRNKLIEYNAEHIPVELQSRYEPIHLTIKDEEGNIAAGLLAVLKWNWIEVDILWLNKAFRQRGCGTELLSQVESIAKEKGCTFIKLYTFSFQAPEFYGRHGYKEYAVLDNAPTGSRTHFFMKEL